MRAFGSGCLVSNAAICFQFRMPRCERRDSHLCQALARLVSEASDHADVAGHSKVAEVPVQLLRERSMLSLDIRVPGSTGQ